MTDAKKKEKHKQVNVKRRMSRFFFKLKSWNDNAKKKMIKMNLALLCPGHFAVKIALSHCVF